MTSGTKARAMYAGGRANTAARRWVRFYNHIIALGLFPRRWVVLEVAGRRTGRPVRVPVGMADVADQWYLVSMLGECNWVRNVRAASGHAVLRRRRPRAVRLIELPVDERAPVIKRYVEKVPGGRPHIPVDRHQAVGAFEVVAAAHPVFRVCDTTTTTYGRQRRPELLDRARLARWRMPSSTRRLTRQSRRT